MGYDEIFFSFFCLAVAEEIIAANKLDSVVSVVHKYSVEMSGM